MNKRAKTNNIIKRYVSGGAKTTFRYGRKRRWWGGEENVKVIKASKGFPLEIVNEVR